VSLQSVTVTRARQKMRRAVNYASEVWAINTDKVISIIPSVCKKDGIVDGITNSRVRIDVGDGPSDYLDLWCTETVAAIEDSDNTT